MCQGLCGASCYTCCVQVWLLVNPLGLRMVGLDQELPVLHWSVSLYMPNTKPINQSSCLITDGQFTHACPNATVLTTHFLCLVWLAWRLGVWAWISIPGRGEGDGLAGCGFSISLTCVAAIGCTFVCLLSSCVCICLLCVVSCPF